MIYATIEDRSAVVTTLSASFTDNQSVGFIVGTGAGRIRRVCRLMSYSFRNCLDFGKVLLSEDRRCCALVLLPDRKRISLAALFRDVDLASTVIGFRLLKALRREALVKAQHPAVPFYYLWFIGVEPAVQGMGRGTNMMRLLLADAQRMGRPVYLETSVERNVSWYMSLGFEVYYELDLGYRLYFLRKLN